jgi:3-isopropylmalate/(R)-2-methylmalate dehydratase small subunit
MKNIKTKLSGKVHKFGDDLNIDAQVMPYKYKVQFPFDAEKLVPHLFEEVIPEFYKRVNPGDFVVAGRNFACGKPHPQGFMAIAELKLVLLCESMPYNAYRGAISSGVICHRRCIGIRKLVNDGDQVEMDFATGEFHNLTTNSKEIYSSVPLEFFEMMQCGGMKQMLKKWHENQSRNSQDADKVV